MGKKRDHRSDGVDMDQGRCVIGLWVTGAHVLERGHGSGGRVVGQREGTWSRGWVIVMWRVIGKGEGS